MTRSGRYLCTRGRLAAAAATVAILAGLSAAPARGLTVTGGTPVPTSTAFATVGDVGCSQTVAAVMGYQADGGRRLWPATGAYGGGTVVEWASSTLSPYWSAFQTNLKYAPTTTIWVQLCTKATDTDTANLTAAHVVLNEVRRRVPGARILVSAQNGYVAPHVCPVAGANGPARMQTLADRLVGEGLAQAGPRVGALRGPDSAGTGTDELLADGCHPNDTGARDLGDNLLAFFG